MKFEIHRSTDKQFYFILRTKNGEILFSSETYKRKAGALKAIAALKMGVSSSITIDVEHNYSSK